MAKRIFEINKEAIFESDAFATATAEELRVLVAVMADRAATDEQIAEAAKVSAARCRAAITLFESERVLTAASAVTDEFESPVLSTDMDEDRALTVANDIRDRGLASLISELSRIFKKPALSTGQVKKIVALYTNYSLSEEYILTLAAYLSDKGKPSVTRLANEALKLVEREVDTPEALYAYIEDRQRDGEINVKYRQFYGYNNRGSSEFEREMLAKWMYEYGYSDSIINLAFSITADNTGSFKTSYIDRILTRWHECGCKTLAECEERRERDSAMIAEEKRLAAQKKKSERNEPKTPKYGAFSAEDALMRALERSYGSDED